MPLIYGAQGVTPSLRGQPTNVMSVQAGEAVIIPAGAWNIQLDGYSSIQMFDPVTGIWKSIGGESSVFHYVNTDGVNWRVANQTGCVVGAIMTTLGTTYTQTTLPTVTAGSGGALFNVIGGQYVTSVTVVNAGNSYLYPPQILFDAPPAGAGVQATAHCTLSGKTISTVTVDNNGAGYTNVPNCYVIPDPRDTTGYGGACTAVLAGSGGVNALLVTNHGTPLTSRPALTFSAGSAAATAIMDFSITAYTVTSAGSGYQGNIEISALGNGLAGITASLTNPVTETSLVRTRKASILVLAGSTSISTAGATVLDGGIYAGTNPTQIIYGAFTGSVGNVGFTFGSNLSYVNMQAA